MFTIALVKGQDRYENIRKALDLIKGEMEIPKKQILLKPNFVSTRIPLAATHPDAVRAIMDFFLELGVKSFLIGEASAENTSNGYRRFGYMELEKNYPIKLIDLNDDSWVKTKILDRSFRTIEVRVSKTLLESYRVSVTRPKTHDMGIVTLALKNTAMGSLIGRDKNLVHQGYRAFNLNLAKLAKLTAPDLAVIDGVVGMEGNGPVFGKEIQSGFSVASVNGLACDMVTTTLMGFNHKDVGYLYYESEIGLGPRNMNETKIVGEKIENCTVRFHPHHHYKEQLNWKLENWKPTLYRIL